MAYREFRWVTQAARRVWEARRDEGNIHDIPVNSRKVLGSIQGTEHSRGEHQHGILDGILGGGGGLTGYSLDLGGDVASRGAGATVPRTRCFYSPLWMQLGNSRRPSLMVMCPPQR